MNGGPGKPGNKVQAMEVAAKDGSPTMDNPQHIRFGELR